MGSRLRLLVLTGFLVLGGCAVAPPGPPHLSLTPARFSELPGWADDDPAQAIPALLRSCRGVVARGDNGGIGGGGTDWKPICAEAATLAPQDSAGARRFFERNFTPVHATNRDQEEGLFTGYCEIALRGSRTRSGTYTAPLYHRPPDLISVDLGRFRASLKGQRIAGRVVGEHLVPYHDRGAIETGALDGKGLEFLWIDNPVDAFFLEIQGSGRVTLPDGQVVRVGYDGSNGQPYVSIGHILAETGIPVDQISLSFLRQWIAAHPERGRALMDRNPSYVFFKEMTGEGPLGAEGVVLTPERSIAVDPAFIPYGLPVWIDTSDRLSPSGRLRRLMVSQDTGGAIKGPVRADIFFGFGPSAEQHAGSMRGQGDWWLLLPRTVTLPAS